MAYTTNCRRCGAVFTGRTNRAAYCGASCRSVARHTRNAAAAELLRRQTAAVISGDTAALAAVQRDALRLFAEHDG